ncbi:MAG: hypothetical protein H5T69_15335, partial [Chloroflexi bacterium]|nr:hypothetical protein [Chloroflexota bacterium]
PPATQPVQPTVVTPEPSLPTEPAPTLTLAPTFTLPAPTQAGQPSATTVPPSATPGPKPDEAQHLVFVQGGSVYRGDYFGADPIEVAAVAQLEDWDFHRGLLAMARSASVYVINLLAGTLKEFRLTLEGPIEYTELLWGSEGQRLLHVTAFKDDSAPTFHRSLDLRALDPQSGDLRGRAVVRDVTGAHLLRYEEETNRVVLIPIGDKASFDRVAYYDLGSGLVMRTVSIRGQEAAISPQGRWLLTQEMGEGKQGASLYLYDLFAEGQARPREWQHPKETHSAAHIWSPDGRFVAYLLRQGATYEQATRGLGLWLLDTTTMQAKEVLAEEALSSSLVSWTPDGLYIVGYHRGGEGDTFYYAVRPDGGDRRILSLSPEAEVLGWMPPAVSRDVPKVTLDPWRPRFLDTAGDAEAMADVAAEFLAAQAPLSEEELSTRLTQYLQDAGWPMDYRGVRVKRVAEGQFVAPLPSFGLYVLSEGRAERVASGNVLIDARREGEELGLIFGILESRGVQPAFILLQARPDGAWAPKWTPQGRRDWVSTDGEIRFVGEGLSKLWVAGTSFGLEYGPERVFAECQECPHRRLRATWVRQGDGYVRETSLPPDAPLHRVYWEMTEPTPYAILFETLWRLRNGLSADDLLAGPQVKQQLQQYGLLDTKLLLIPEEEMANGVRFADAEGKKRFYALAKDNRLVHVQLAPGG